MRAIVAGARWLQADLREDVGGAAVKITSFPTCCKKGLANADDVAFQGSHVKLGSGDATVLNGGAQGRLWPCCTLAAGGAIGFSKRLETKQ